MAGSGITLGLRRIVRHVCIMRRKATLRLVTLATCTFVLAPIVAGAQSHLPPCPSDRNEVWTDCTGVYSYPDGSKYDGEYGNNQRNGQGTLTFANGDKYAGESNDGKENGQGTYTFADGDEYVGEWKDNKRNGQGTQTYSDGSKYVGEFQDDKRNGQGTLTWPNGHKYVGQWKDNKQNGQGTLTSSNGEPARCRPRKRHQTNSMEYRGVRYIIKIGIAREQWRVAIDPAGGLPEEKTIFGRREDAESKARSMIDAWLRKKQSALKARLVE
jgi:hypothetical protein